jgi:LysR family transcriptional regulator, glycine cleavage system transcriptional activator
MDESCSSIVMTKDPPPLTALRAFVAAARHESLRQAAVGLSVTPSAISHQIRVLEDWVGTPLFVREVRQVRLTSVGRRLFNRLDKGFDAINSALDEASTAAKDTVLRVSALPLFTSVWLIPRLERFEACFGKLAIEIDTTSKLVDLDRGEVDIAIRNVPKPHPQLVARKLLDLRVVPLCAPSVAADLKCPEDLGRATFIHIAAGSRGWKQWLANAGLDQLKPRSNLSFDTIPAALDAAAMGRGVLLGLDPLIWDAPASRDLVIPFRSAVQSAGAYFVVHRRADRSRHAVRAFSDWLVQEMKADSQRLKLVSRRALSTAVRTG